LQERPHAVCFTNESGTVSPAHSRRCSFVVSHVSPSATLSPAFHEAAPLAPGPLACNQLRTSGCQAHSNCDHLVSPSRTLFKLFPCIPPILVFPFLNHHHNKQQTGQPRRCFCCALNQPAKSVQLKPQCQPHPPPPRPPHHVLPAIVVREKKKPERGTRSR